jgi:DHA3 family macrolide efflux protein-like MFS transporter
LLRTHKLFYILLVTQTLSLVGSRMTSIGVGIWVFAETGKTTPLLLTSFFNELPGMLAGSLAGVVVDRWDRRRVMILADIGQAVGSVLLMVSFLSGRFEVWHLYGVAFLQGVFSSFQGPAERAATTMLVSEAYRERANALKETSFPLAGIFAPVLTGLLYTVVGIAGIILIDLTTFLIAVIFLIFIQIPHPERSEHGLAALGGFWNEAFGALRYVMNRRALFMFMLFTAFINFMLNGPLDLTLPYLILLMDSEKIAGSIIGVTSLGAFGGAALIAAWGGTRPRMKTIILGLIITGVMFIFFGVLRTPVSISIVLFLLFMNLPIGQTMYISILQVKSPPDLQGRIFALNDQLGFIGSTASFALTGYLVDHVVNPSVGTQAWKAFQPLVGKDAGAGIGLVEVVTGVIILAATLLMFAPAHFRELEARYPDYEAGSTGQLV